MRRPSYRLSPRRDLTPMSSPIRIALAAAVFAGGVRLSPAAEVGDDFLRISFIDVGQGDAIWIQGPTGQDGSPGKNILIDGGPDRSTRNRLTKYLRAYRLPEGSTIDCMVITHPHNDHYPGLADILEKYDVRTIIDSGYPS